MKEHTYYVKGIHCSSCEVLIEKTLIELPEIKAVKANNGSGEVTIEHEGERPSVEALNKLFKKLNYEFSDKPFPETHKMDGLDWAIIFGALLVLGSLFFVLNKLNLGD